MTIPMRNNQEPNPLKLPDDACDPAARTAWLRERYMKNFRDHLFDDLIREILVTDAAGNLTARPQKIGLVNETRGVLVLGPARSGKTALIGRNLSRHPAIALTEDTSPGNVFYFRVSSSPTLKGVGTDILKKSGYTKISDKLRTSQIWDMVAQRFATLGITCLWLDEAHHMMELKKEKTDVLRLLKTLLQGDNAIAVIVSGVPALNEEMQTDPETNERFVRIKLNPIQTERERTELKSFIEGCCRHVELSMPEDEHLTERLVAAFNGSLGRSMECTHSAIGRALRRADGVLRLDDFRRFYILKRGSHDDGPFDPEPWPELEEILDKQGWSA